MRDDDAFDRLSRLGEFVLHEPHVAQHLADNGVAGAGLLELDDEQALLVLADREDVERAGVGRIVPTLLAVFLEDVEVFAEFGLPRRTVKTGQ